MKHIVARSLLAITLAASGCDTGRIPAAQPASANNRPPAASVDPTDGVPHTPGGTIYGEVVAATSEIIEALDLAETDAAAASAALHGAVQRFKVAARNWNIYLANADDAEIGLLQQGQLAEEASAADEKLRATILRAAHNPAEDFHGELRNLIRVLRESLSNAERADFDQWIAQNELK